MFRQFRKLVVPFMLASLSPLLINSPARADSSYWTDWHKCTFSTIKNQYTPWRARIAVRSSDGAARPVQVEFGPYYQNDEPIFKLEASDSWDTGGQHRISPNTHSEYFNPALYGSKSQNFSNLTWISKRLPRYARIVLKHDNGRDVCTSEIRL